MKIRGSVVSFSSFSFPHSPEDEGKKTRAQKEPSTDDLLGYNPLRASKSLPILTSSQSFPQKGFQCVVKGVKEPVIQKRFRQKGVYLNYTLMSLS